MQKEVSHYVVTAHPPGAVLVTAKCNFLSPDSLDVLIAKARRLEIRQLRNKEENAPSPFPVVNQIPINGRLTSLIPIKIPSNPTSLVFMTTERLQYAVISYDPHAPGVYPMVTHASGSLKAEDQGILGREAESGPLSATDPHKRCIALHIYDGLITILPVNMNYAATASRFKDESSQLDSVLGQAFHARIEENVVLAITFLQASIDTMPQLCVLYQDSRGAQHITTHVVNLPKKQLHLYGSQSAPPTTEWIKKSSVDGGSSLLIPIPPKVTAAAAASTNTKNVSTESTKYSSGGVVVVGQRQLTFVSATATKVSPVPQAVFLTYEELPVDPNGMPRYLLGDEFGNLHMLNVMTVNEKIVALQLETLGSCNLSSSLAYLGEGLVFVGSVLGNSQLVQIHDEPIPLEEIEQDVDLVDTTYLTEVEEYTNLGPILDFDLVPTAPGSDSYIAQSQVVTASGSSKSGSIRLVRNGIGMNEYAAVEIPGIQNMWSLRKSFVDPYDAYLVQSFVGETRVLGIVAGMQDDDEGPEGTLEEVFLPGLQAAASTLFIANVKNYDRLVQVTDSDIRVITTSGELLDLWEGTITLAAGNEAGQIAIAQSGGSIVYFIIEDDKIKEVSKRKMEREISCLNLNPLSPLVGRSSSSMDIDENRLTYQSNILAIGLWDDFTVRLLSLQDALQEMLRIDLGTEEEDEGDEFAVASPSRRNRNNMMARSLCLVTLDFSPSSSSLNGQSPGVNMLFVGLGDGSLISFAVVLNDYGVSVQSKKEVCLGTQRIDLVPLTTELGGTCVLATGDRPTVIYLAGIGGNATSQFNPKLCYSNVNLSSTDYSLTEDLSPLPSQQTIAVNVASPFYSPLLFDASSLSNQHYSLCIADDKNLRLGVIDDIQKLHVTTCRLGMAPRRIVHCSDGRLFAVGCIESGINHFTLGGDEANMGNCIRFMDDTNFDDIDRVSMEPYEMILSMAYVSLRVPSSSVLEEANGGADGESTLNNNFKPFLLVGTARALPDEDEPTNGRILVYSFQTDENGTPGDGRIVRQVTEFSTNGGVYSICQFFDGKVLCSVNSKTHVVHLLEEAGVLRLEFLGVGHHGHILSLFVKSLAKSNTLEAKEMRDSANLEMTERESDYLRKKPSQEEKLAIVGDLMRSISLVQYYPEHETLEEVARDFNANWTTAIEMLTEDVYLGAENWHNLFCLRRNKTATSEEIRCRLDTIGEFHLGEMCNKFMKGSLVMPASSNNSNKSQRRAVRRGNSPQKRKLETPKSISARTRRPVVVTGSQTLFGTVEGTLGIILGLDGRTAAFFSSLERSMTTVVKPVGGFSHHLYRSCHAERRVHPSHGFIDGDLVESFLDLDRSAMEAIVKEMNRDGGWEVDDIAEASADDKKDGDEDKADDNKDHLELSVDDVLAMVEEMSMLH